MKGLPMDYAIAQLESSLTQAENNEKVYEAEGNTTRVEHYRSVAKDLRAAIEKLKTN